VELNGKIYKEIVYLFFMKRRVKPVFVEFESDFSNNEKEYFVGASLEDVLADTNGGTEFGSANYLFYRPISLRKARVLGLEFFDYGLNLVREGRVKSFKIGISKD